MTQQANSIQIEINFFNFPENNFFQQILQYKKLSRIFASGESVAARKPPEFHHGKCVCFNPHPLFGV